MKGADSLVMPYGETTNIWCWWCCHPFTTECLGLPVKFKPKSNSFELQGCFCSFACMKAYNCSTSRYKQFEISTNLTLLYKRMFGFHKSDSVITMAPPKSALKVFGGTLSIKEFRKCEHEGRVIKEMIPPFVPIKCKFEDSSFNEKSSSHSKDTKQTITVNENQTLKLQRVKPLLHNKGTLEQTMGLMISKNKK